MGTADYVSPEQVTDSHSVDIRSDIYSLGCTLYKLLSGQAPFVGPEYKNDFDKMMAHVQKTPPPISLLRTDLPPELTAIVERMMAKEPDQRFATPAEVAAALAPLAAGATCRRLLAEATGLSTPSRSGEPRTTTTGPLSASPHTDTGVELPWPRSAETRVEVQPAANCRAAAPRASRAHRVRIVAILARDLAGLILLGVVLLRVKTPSGTIILEVDQLELAGAVVEVDGQQRVTIDPGQGLEKVTVAADEKEHVLRVTKGGFETFTRKFTLKAGDKQTMTVRLEPLVAPSPRTPQKPSRRQGEGPGKAAVAKSTPPAPREETPTMKPATPAQPPAKTDNRRPLRANSRGAHGCRCCRWRRGPPARCTTSCPASSHVPRSCRGSSGGKSSPSAPRDVIHSIDWSATGPDRLCIGIGDGAHLRWTTLELKAVICVTRSPGHAFHVRWSPDGSRLAIIPAYCGTCCRFGSPTGRWSEPWKEMSCADAKFSWSPDCQRIACGDVPDQKQVRIVNLDGTPGGVFKGHEDLVTAVAWSPDGKQLVSSSRDKTVRIWNLDGTSGPVLKGHEIYVNDVDWSPDGKWIVSASEGDVRLWKPDGTAGPVIPVANIQHIRWHPDSRRFVIGSGNTDRIGIYDIESQQMTQFRDIPFMGGPASWSRDGKELVLGDHDGNIFVWDDKGRRLRSLSGGSLGPMMVAWSSTGQLASKDRRWHSGVLGRRWPTRADRQRHDRWWPRHALESRRAGLAIRRRHPTCSCGMPMGREARRFIPSGDDVAWRPDGKQFAALTDSEIRIWDADTRERTVLESRRWHITRGTGIR